ADDLEILALHRRLGHTGKNTGGKIIAAGLGGSVRSSDLKDFECPACIEGKGTKLAAAVNNPSVKRATQPLEQISVNI
ncbi:UNVERIFIED_CONTAM: GAG-pre-integrase domain-containing protein, partial [Bacteroidetes bacterium 56_B9]